MFNKVQLCVLRDYDIAPKDAYSCKIYNQYYHKYHKQLKGMDKTQAMHTIQLNYFKGKYITNLEYWYQKYITTNHSHKIGKYIVRELDNPNGLLHPHHRYQHIYQHPKHHHSKLLASTIKAHSQADYDNRVHILTRDGNRITKY